MEELTVIHKLIPPQRTQFPTIYPRAVSREIFKLKRTQATLHWNQMLNRRFDFWQMARGQQTFQLSVK